MNLENITIEYACGKKSALFNRLPKELQALWIRETRENFKAGFYYANSLKA